MAFQKQYLHKIESLGMGGTFWCYDTTEAAATVAGTSYFNGEGSEHIRLGDVMMVRTFNSLSAPTSITTVGLHVVIAAGTAIDLGAATALAVA